MDPARFWQITPRLLEIEIRGVKQRLKRERELVWWGAMLPHMTKPVPLEVFLGQPVNEAARVRKFHAAWDKVDRAMRRG